MDPRQIPWLQQPWTFERAAHRFVSLSAVRDSDGMPVRARFCVECYLIQVETRTRSGNRTWVSICAQDVPQASNEES